MKYKILLLYLLLLSFTGFASTEDNFKVRVAVVDVQSIWEGSLAIKGLQNKVNRLNQKIQQDITKIEEEFKPLEEKLLNERAILSEDDFEQKVNEFNARVSEIKREIQIRKTTLERAHAEAMGKIHEMTSLIISELAEKYNLNLVIPSAQILYAKNNLNITSEVTFILNERLKDVPVNY